MGWRSLENVLRATLVGSISVLMCDLKWLERASSIFMARRSGKIVSDVVGFANVSLCSLVAECGAFHQWKLLFGIA